MKWLQRQDCPSVVHHIHRVVAHGIAVRRNRLWVAIHFGRHSLGLHAHSWNLRKGDRIQNCIRNGDVKDRNVVLRFAWTRCGLGNHIAEHWKSLVADEDRLGDLLIAQHDGGAEDAHVLGVGQRGLEIARAGVLADAGDEWC